MAAFTAACIVVKHPPVPNGFTHRVAPKAVAETIRAISNTKRPMPKNLFMLFLPPSKIYLYLLRYSKRKDFPPMEIMGKTTPFPLLANILRNAVCAEFGKKCIKQ
jgi:hypothetical protein